MFHNSIRTAQLRASSPPHCTHGRWVSIVDSVSRGGHTETTQMSACLPSHLALAVPRARPGQCKNMLISARAMREVASSGVGRVAARERERERQTNGGGGAKNSQPSPPQGWVVAILFRHNLLCPIFLRRENVHTRSFHCVGRHRASCTAWPVSSVLAPKGITYGFVPTFRSYVMPRSSG